MIKAFIVSISFLLISLFAIAYLFIRRDEDAGDVEFLALVLLSIIISLIIYLILL